MDEGRPLAFYGLAAFFGLFVLFLYGPMIVIFILSFQGPTGGLTFPMNGVSLHWFHRLWEGGGIVDIAGAFKRSLALGLVVMVLTILFSLTAGLAFRKKFFGSNALFYVAVASLIVPSIVTSLGIAIEFHVLDDLVKNYGPSWIADGYTTAMGQFTSGLGAHLTWTLPFGLLVMFAIFNRFDVRFEEAARDQGATPWQTLRHVVLPIILPSVIGVGLFGFTLSWDHGRAQHPADGIAGADDDGDQPRHLRARHIDDRGLVRGHRDCAGLHFDPERASGAAWLRRRPGLNR
jgi:putative spermidine/putrescine transport system permease protein